MRLDFKEGKWLACDWQGGRIGDNIDVVRFVKPDATFPDAVFELTGSREELPTRIAVPRVKPEALRRPSIPYERGRASGRTYLRDVRGITEATITHAEAAGALRYLDNGVLFTGRDASKAIRSATIRYIEPLVGADGKVVAKRDFADSDKAYPTILPGTRARVVVVEGGVNGLAVRDMALRARQEAPTIVVTGGVGVRRWIRENDDLRQLLELAGQVEIVGEREVRDGVPDPVKQAKTDALREQLAAEIAAARQGELPGIVMPPLGIADAADWNQQQAKAAAAIENGM